MLEPFVLCLSVKRGEFAFLNPTVTDPHAPSPSFLPLGTDGTEGDGDVKKVTSGVHDKVAKYSSGTTLWLLQSGASSQIDYRLEQFSVICIRRHEECFQ